MRNVIADITELIRLTSTDMSPEIENLIRKAIFIEEIDSPARGALETILANIVIARKNSTPICQDTGTPTYYVCYPLSWAPGNIREQIITATKDATDKGFLRPNAVNSLTSKNSGNNFGDQYFPVIHLKEIVDDRLSIDLILKGGGCENVGAQYSLPLERLNANRDLDGVRKVVLESVFQAQGEGCAPGFLGVAIGGDRGTSYITAKEAHLLNPSDRNPETQLDELEKRITSEANDLGIGPMGFGGRSTILGTKITSTYRLPASFFVSVSYMCWAFRHRKMIVMGDKVIFE